jgi:uncharacterized RDD family membrane protein YckC
VLCSNHVDEAEGVRRCARCAAPFCPDCLVELSGRPYCGACKAEHLLDLRSGVDRSQLPLASLGRRFAAILLDGLLIFIPMCIILALVVFFTLWRSETLLPMLNLLRVPFALLTLLYEGLMLQFKDGQTLGKMVMRVRVVRPDGTSISTGQAWGRVVTRTVLGCVWFINYLPAFFTPEKTSLHDMLAGTRVVEISAQ